MKDIMAQVQIKQADKIWVYFSNNQAALIYKVMQH